VPLKQRVSQELLPYVRQPAQYIGGEWNQLVHEGDWEKADVRIAVAFPDTYTIGMSHLGCQILYWLCNHIDRVCAERVYCPWIDAEPRMRDKKIPLFTWDTRQEVASADILAISLQYEMGFTNVLTLLDLAGIPFHAKDRDDRHPLVIAGGPQADNPEPVADFFDLIVVGDGEIAMTEITKTYRELKQNGIRRRDMIVELAQRFPWIYAPSLYEISYNPDNTIHRVTPTHPAAAGSIERCQTPDFENAPFPTRPIVPFVEVIHDRISIEIMRGCPQRCRFCHAGYTKRPVGMRTVDKILDIAEEAYRHTGHEEIGLLSLSTADYPDIRELSQRINDRFGQRKVNISLPSLRVDKMLQNIPWMVNAVRKGGLTLAVEAAKDDMRAAIRKKVTDGNLIEGVQAAYAAGWSRLKLYFMCGFPGEREDDITAIPDICRQISDARKPIAKGSPGRVNGSVSWLVPKPFTPFQWAAQPTADYFHHARALLAQAAGPRRGAVRVKTHGVERSILEAVFARGDRRLAPAIETAWKLGARFDGWDETFNNTLWTRAFDQTATDPAWYAHRERPYTETLPWAHIHSGPDTTYLQHQYDDTFVKIGSAKPPALPILTPATA
jgi:radical SAM family uncharacterized protein